MFQKVVFKKYSQCGMKMTCSDGHCLCLLSLGEGYSTGDYKRCLQFTQKAQSNRVARLKANLWERVLNMLLKLSSEFFCFNGATAVISQ